MSIKSKINSLNEYMPNSINIEPFPLEPTKNKNEEENDEES